MIKVEFYVVITHQYSNDTQLYMKLSPRSDNIKGFSNSASKVAEWFPPKRLILNSENTKAIFFYTAPR